MTTTSTTSAGSQPCRGAEWQMRWRYRSKFRLRLPSMAMHKLSVRSLARLAASTGSVTEELQTWQMQAVEGHFNSKRPWLSITSC
jgi:hypothetical protein